MPSADSEHDDFAGERPPPETVGELCWLSDARVSWGDGHEAVRCRRDLAGVVTSQGMFTTTWST